MSYLPIRVVDPWASLESNRIDPPEFKGSFAKWVRDWRCPVEGCNATWAMHPEMCADEQA